MESTTAAPNSAAATAAPVARGKVDILVCIVIASLPPFWLPAFRFPGGGGVEFGHLTSLLLLAATAYNVVAWPKLLEVVRRDWFLAYILLYGILATAGLMHGEPQTLSFVFGRVFWATIMLCLIARQPSARTIYWAVVYAVLCFFLCFLYSSNQAGLSIIDLYTEVFFNGNTYFGRYQYLKDLIHHYADPFAPIGRREDSVNIFSYVSILFTFLLLLTRNAVERFRGKTILDNLLVIFATSFSIIALSRTAILILLACILVSLVIISLKSGSAGGFLGLFGLGIVMLLALGTDSSISEGLRDRFFNDDASIDARVSLNDYANDIISQNPFTGNGSINSETDQLSFHNLYLGAWAAAGVGGLVAALFYLTVFILNWLRAVTIARLPRREINGWSINWLHALMLPPILMSFVSGGLGLVGGFALITIGIGFLAIDQVTATIKAQQVDATDDEAAPQTCQAPVEHSAS
ncbi:MAG: O-antigen ligase family protein [Alphaproteobacteria bacterium]